MGRRLLKLEEDDRMRAWPCVRWTWLELDEEVEEASEALIHRLGL